MHGDECGAVMRCPIGHVGLAGEGVVSAEVLGGEDTSVEPRESARVHHPSETEEEERGKPDRAGLEPGTPDGFVLC